MKPYDPMKCERARAALPRGRVRISGGGGVGAWAPPQKNNII